MKIDINNIWSQLKSQADKKVLKEHVLTIGKMHCYIGFIGLTNNKMFQCDIPNIIPSEVDNLKKFRGVDLYILPKHDSKQKKFVILLTEEDLEEVFTLFIKDLLKNLHFLDDEHKGFMAINKRINYWQRLFEKVPSGLLSKEKQRGLYGELYLLRMLLHKGKNSAQVVKSWVGTEGLRQDFLYENKALEVKTQLIGSTSISISNEFQLDFTVLKKLHLCVILINESQGTNNTLFKIITEINGLLKHDFSLADDFQQKLAFLGITETVAFNSYNQTNFSVKKCSYYKIDDGFPLLINPHIKNEAIHSVRYKITLSRCSQNEIKQEEALAFIDNNKSTK